ncbi:MAG TPA: SigE family RNA polymerase sigma factor [Pseudonocardiaceae bacterium]|jgi:RNA polymerase sigma-70 factor (sigma-E family)|nr:SigE family RNA polymerase sigma factor [Pseudonocardiaceae bacterium]
MPATFPDFVGEHLDELVRYATALTCDPHLAQDVVQEVLIRVHRNWSRIGKVDEPAAYVRRMLVNEYLSWHRRRANHDLAVPDPAARTTPSVDDPATGLAERDAMRARIARLSRRQRAVIVLRYYENLTDPEIAQVLRCTPATVRSHVSHALAALRAQESADGRAAPLHRPGEGINHAV